jgi:hypothetical protein
MPTPRLRLLPLIALLLAGAFAAPARAVDLTKYTLGLGVESAFGGGGGPAQLSAKAALSPRLHGSVLLGFSAGSGLGATFVPGAKLSFVLVPEEHLNFYGAFAMGLDLRSVGGLRAFEWRLGPGVELFASEWPHLGFAVEFGLAGSLVAAGNPDRRPAIATATTGFGGAGIHYYF